MSSEIRVPISHDADIVTARSRGRELAVQIGFKGTDLTLIATAISEVARNILSYAKSGDVILDVAADGPRKGIQVVADDQGPGIPNIDEAMRDGFSTGNSLGLGLPGARRLMDDFEIASQVGRGTRVTMRKWLR